MTPGNLTNIAIEQSAVGALLSDSSGSEWLKLGNRFGPQHLSEPLHGRIVEVIARLCAEGKSVSPMVVAAILGNDATLAELGGMAYLARLVANACTPFALRTRIDLLVGLAARRAAHDAATQLQSDAFEMSVEGAFRLALSGHVERVQQIFVEGSGRKTTYSAFEASAALVEHTSRIVAGGVDTNAVHTGLENLDQLTGGLHRGELIILAARPSMGKTALATQLAYSTALNGGGVHYASLEMPVALLMPRLVSCRLWSPVGANNIPYTRIMRGHLTPVELRWVTAAANEIAPFSLIVDDAPGLSPAELEARALVSKAKFERAGKSLDLLVVDHLHKMRLPGAVSKVAEFTEISGRLAEMAKRLNCPVLALAQLNRGVENRDDKRPQLADLRESGSIEQDADTVMFVYRPGYYLERKRCTDPGAEADRLADLAAIENKMEVLVEKQRSGPVGAIDLWCDLALNVVLDPASPEFREVAA